jgi:DNA polymerase alpha subunit A
VTTEVNKLYRALELDIDGVFKSMLLLKKKKYAALTINERDGKVFYEQELKGLDLVRRDWATVSKDTGKWVVDQILSGKPREEIVIAIHDHLEDLATKIRANALDLKEFIVTKGLNKNPKDYPDVKGQPHLQVALQMIKQNRPVNIGDHIPYVICKQGPDGSTPAQRAKLPDEVFRSNGELTVDFEWYLTNQILPPISRLCEPIEGTSTATISEKLGLDSTKFRQANNDDVDHEDYGFVPKCKMPDADRFVDCAKLTYSCRACGKADQEFTGSFNPVTGTSGLSCGECGAMYLGRRNAGDCYSYLANRVSLQVRACVKNYYDCWLRCDDTTCSRRTMQQSVMGYACTENCKGRMVQDYDEARLHTQLKYLECLFSFERAVKNRWRADKAKADGVSEQGLSDPSNKELKEYNHGIPKEHQDVLMYLKTHMENSVNGSAYNWVRPSLWSTVFGKVLTGK